MSNASFDYTPDTLPSLERCRFRTVLEDQECECPLKGPHQVHRYIAPKSGRTYRFEILTLTGEPA